MFLLTELQRQPYHWAWFLRTQKPTGKLDNQVMNEFCIYSTNSFKVKHTNKGNQLLYISFPESIKEIVIDYSALVTLFELNLLEAVNKRFNKIYYPDQLIEVFIFDQSRYSHHQPSRIRIYEQLANMIGAKIRELSIKNVSKKDDTFDKINLNLAVQEEALFLDSFIDIQNVDSKFNKFIVRLEQLVLWLYEKGKIRKSNYQEIIKTCIGKTIVNKKIDFERNIKFIISFSELEQLQKYDLIDILIENGFYLLIETHSANYIRNNVYSIHELARIGDRSKELKNKINKLNHFESFHKEISEKNNEQHCCTTDYHRELMINPFWYASENSLYLLSDDRLPNVMI